MCSLFRVPRVPSLGLVDLTCPFQTVCLHYKGPDVDSLGGTRDSAVLINSISHLLNRVDILCGQMTRRAVFDPHHYVRHCPTTIAIVPEKDESSV